LRTYLGTAQCAGVTKEFEKGAALWVS